jgi:glycyl-tRNA synthetase beta chain
MQADALEHLSSALKAALAKAGLTPASMQGFVTPRRVAVSLSGLPTTQADVSTELKGPKVGAPEAALEGFLKKTGLTKEQLENRDGVYFATVHQKGKPTAEVLKSIIEEMLSQFPWPKSMRWGSGETAWVRPLHSILCLFDGKVIDVEFAGVKAGNTTRGHRFLSGKELTISDAKSYKKIMDDNFVIADREERKANILQQVEKAAAAKGLALKPDAGLLEEVVGLVEWPVVLIGTIDEAFMDLPPEVLTTVMRSHQKYFSLLSKDGKLAPHFVIVSNMTPSDGGKAIVSGNERVLRARFSDARFFWDTDRKKPLSDWAQGLKTVTYHAKLGTIAQKVERIGSLAEKLAETIGADTKLVAKAAQLAKADLVTGMVGEFAELQGIMGRYYARKQNEDAKVADAIRDHYKPQGPSDNVPTEKVAVCVALADKLDTLISMFAIGEKPTGSKDPFALRRAALGIIRIVLENDLRLPLLPLLAQVPTKDIALLAAQEKLVKQTEAELKHPPKVGKYLTVSETATQDIPEGTAQKVAAELLAFFHDRLIVQMKDQGIRHDVIKAVIASGDDDLVRIVARAKAVQEFIGTEDGKNLLAGYKRAANILSIEEKKDKLSYTADALNAKSLSEEAEKALASLLAQKTPELEKLCKTEKFADAMNALAALRAPIDAFFEKTLVNCEDKELRANRLRLLASIKGSVDSIANFSLIEG